MGSPILFRQKRPGYKKKKYLVYISLELWQMRKMQMEIYSPDDKRLSRNW